jgi:hypothetical protein
MKTNRKLYFASWHQSETYHHDKPPTQEVGITIEELDIIHEEEDYYVQRGRDRYNNKPIAVSKSSVNNLSHGPYFTTKEGALAYLRNAIQRSLDKTKELATLLENEINKINQQI